jgi:NAD(P)H-flavin reductase
MATTVANPANAGVMVPLSFRVDSLEQDTADTSTLTLSPVGDRTPPIRPGQFMMVYVFGIGEVPISVSGTSHGGVVELTVRDVGAVSRAICASGPGTILGLRGPFGTSWPIEAAEGSDVIVVAGGIGLAPLRMLIRHVIGTREEFAAFSVLYGARTPADLLYLDELEAWRERADVAVTVDAADATWVGHVGVVPKLIGPARFDPRTAHAFLCGPEVMMDFTILQLLGHGIASERIHLSMERHMDCGVGLCGHCQLGPTLICRDGPVYTHSEIAPWLEVREL